MSDGEDVSRTYYAPMELTVDKLIELCRWERDAIDAHLSAGADRTSAGQRKTSRLLGRIADYLEEHSV